MRETSRGFPGRRITAGSMKIPNNVSITFLNTVHLLPKDLRFEHGGAKLIPVEMARSKIFQVRTARNHPWTEDICSFSNRPVHGPLNN